MTGLFDLPSELLFQIIDLVLSSPCPIPPNGKRYRPAWKSSGRQLTCFPSPGSIWAPNALDLLLASRRLSSETKLYLFKKPQPFKCDLVTVNNHWIWPTWRIIPIRDAHGVLDRVEINLIPCCTEDERHLQTDWTRSGDSVIEVLSRHHQSAFVEDVSRIVKGQLFTIEGHLGSSEESLVTRINTLVINIDTTRYVNGNEILSEEDVPLRKIEGLAHLNFDPLYPVDSGSSHYYLDKLRSSTKMMINRWRFGVVHEQYPRRIGRILFCADGDVLEEFNLTDHVVS